MLPKFETEFSEFGGGYSGYSSGGAGHPGPHPGYNGGGGKGFGGSSGSPGGSSWFGGGGCKCAACAAKKLKASIMAAVLFAVLASPFAFGLVNSAVGRLVRVVGPSGVPTLAGLAIHAAVYGLITRRLMH